MNNENSSVPILGFLFSNSFALPNKTILLLFTCLDVFTIVVSFFSFGILSTLFLSIFAVALLTIDLDISLLKNFIRQNLGFILTPTGEKALVGSLGVSFILIALSNIVSKFNMFALVASILWAAEIYLVFANVVNRFSSPESDKIDNDVPQF